MLRPETLRNNAVSGMLEIAWPDGISQRLPHALLRSRCRCAQCLSERLSPGNDTRLLLPVKVIGIETVGSYGVRFSFSDGHSRGIYPWPMLRAFDAS